MTARYIFKSIRKEQFCWRS